MSDMKKWAVQKSRADLESAPWMDKSIKPREGLDNKRDPVLSRRFAAGDKVSYKPADARDGGPYDAVVVRPSPPGNFLVSFTKGGKKIEVYAHHRTLTPR